MSSYFKITPSIASSAATKPVVLKNILVPATASQMEHEVPVYNSVDKFIDGVEKKDDYVTFRTPADVINYEIHEATKDEKASMTHVTAKLKGGGPAKHQPKGSDIAAGGKDKNISKSFRIDGAYPAMNKKLSPYNQIRVQSTTSFAGYHTSSTSVPTYNSLVISLSADVPNYAAYTAVFDQYRIEKVEVWIIPNGNSEAPASSNGGVITTAVDYDDGNVPTTFTMVSDKQTALTTGVLAGHFHEWVPQFAVAAYSGTFVSYSAQRGWVDSASPSVQHYGLKLAISPTINTGTITYDAIVRCTVAWRGAGIS